MSAKTEGIIRSLRESLKRENEKKTSAYDTRATIRRIEDGVAWVHIPGGVDETPVTLTIGANVGDEVQVRVSGGRAFLVGNASAPPTDNAYARQVNRTLTQEIQTTNTVLGGVKKVVQAVKKIADNTNQYFWHTEEGTDTGAHITEIPQEDFLADPENGGGNLLARSNGIAVRDGLRELSRFSADGLEVLSFDQYGNEVQIAHLGYGAGASETGSEAIEPYYTIGVRTTNSNIGNYSIATGYSTTASGYASHSEGQHSKASGHYSHAEGFLTTASKSNSHAEGRQTVASGLESHAEGWLVTASGDDSHAEGYRSVAKGEYSHAQNCNTIATEEAQTVIGRYNKATISGSGTEADPYVYSDIGDYAFIIGNGGAITRSNALTVDWDGNVECANMGVPKSLAAPTLTKSSGNSTATIASFGGYGKMRMLAITLVTSAAIPAGSNLWVGTISAEARPLFPTGGYGFVGSCAVMGALGNDGSLTIRATGAQIPTNYQLGIYFTYFLN